MRLHESIKQYYIDNLHELSEDKQFHFASRLASWEGAPWAYDLLSQLKPWMSGETDGGIKKVLAEFINAKPKTTINAYQTRQQYFDKYSQLYGLHSALFRVRHLYSVYNIRVLEDLFAIVSQDKIDRLAAELKTDEQAIKSLSTYAINFFYLYKHVLLGDKSYLDLKWIIGISKAYDLRDIKQIQLFIYLFTHCIIGETNFYTEKISAARLNDCKQMLKILEPLINDHFQDINLDNKLEFLVCCRICNADTKLFETIFDESAKSLSHKGQFLIDTHNKNAQLDRATFEKAEHRNVLYIMSTSEYDPRSMESLQK